MKITTTSQYFIALLLCTILLFSSSATVVRAQVDVPRRTSVFVFPPGEKVVVMFRGSTRFPRMKAEATITRNAKETTIGLRAARIPRPFELGAGYVTYVVWAISPEGQVDNLGELRPNGPGESDAKLEVTTLLQAFALIVTAEPHFLVRRPSQQVMLENSYSFQTASGKPINAVPAIQYFGGSDEYFRDSRTPQISELEYSKTPSTILQAKQAVALARFAGADRDAAEEIASAVKTLAEAEAGLTSGRSAKEVDQIAKTAIATAVKAEATAAVRKEARERRNEQARSDAETRQNEDKFAEAQAAIAELKAELARAERLRELSERDAANYAAQLKLDRLEREKELKERAAARQAEAIRIAEQNAMRMSGQIDELTAIQNAARGSADPTSVRLSRFPTVETRSEVRKKDKFSVQVSLTEEKVTEDVKLVSVGKDSTKETEGKLSIALPDAPNVNEWEIDVVLSAASGDFTFSGADTMTITLPRAGDSTTARFNLTAKEFPEAERRSPIFISFYNRATEAFLARVERVIVIKDASTVSQDKPEQNRRARADAEASARMEVEERAVSAERASTTTVTAAAASAALAFSFKDVPPDLTVNIRTKVFPNQAANSQISMTSPHLKNTIRQGEFPRPDQLDALILARFAEFSSLSSRDIGVNDEDKGAPQTAPAAMRGFGEKLYDDHVPETFKRTFWEIRDKLGDKFKTILIITDDPNFPWELVRPRRDEKSASGEFLGLEYAIGRLHAPGGKTVGDSQPQNTVVSGLTVIAPTYQGDQALPQVAKEVDFLKSLSLFDLMDGVRRSDGKFENLRILFDKTPAHIIHFAGHGTSRTRSQKLPSASVQLSDTMLNSDAWRGLLGRFGANRPFFFFNACEVGRAGNFSGFVEGFAPTVLEAGASGYIGALWSIGDSGAKNFAEKFYATMTEDLSKEGSSVLMADLMRKTKAEFLKNGDPTYLAYVFYGDPNLRLTKKAAK